MVLEMVENSKNYTTFLQSAKKAGKKFCSLVKQGEYIRVVSHHDADGLAAAGIMVNTLIRLDAYFRIRITKQIDEKLIQELASEDNSPIIFTDLGSGYLDLLKNELSKNKIIVLDHHPPFGKTFSNLTQVNPHLHGFKGSKDISGAGVTYLVAKMINKANMDLSPLAVVGALGDIQDKNPERKLLDLNEKIVKDAINVGCLETTVDIVVYGRETRPAHKALALTRMPYISGLSGEEDKCLGFLINLGIKLKKDEKWVTFSDLTFEEKQKIFSELAKFLSSKGSPYTTPMSLIGTIYTLTKEARSTPLRDAREYASLLNACGRLDKGGLGVAICAGDRDIALKEVASTLENYRKTIARYMEWLTDTPGAISEMKNVYIVDGHDVIDEKMLSTISSLLVFSPLFKQEKPVIAVTLASDDEIKVSARMSERLVNKGLDLGSIMQKVSEKYAGRGGGHNVAAGAKFPYVHKDDFIKVVDKIVGDKLELKVN